MLERFFLPKKGHHTLRYALAELSPRVRRRSLPAHDVSIRPQKSTDAYGGQTVIYRYDHEGVSYPNEPSAGQSWMSKDSIQRPIGMKRESARTKVLRDAQLLCWPTQVL